MAEVPAIFVSATNAGLRTCREAVRDGLLKQVPARHPVVEQDFPVQDDATQINRKLHDLIAPCDAVICLLGTGYGGEPRQPLPGHPRQSHSQMEYRMAKTLGKRVFLLVAAPGMVLDDHPVESPETLALQQAFVTDLTTANTDFTTFTSLEDLRQLLPRLNLPKPRSAGLIHNLPFRSLGPLFKGRETFLHSLHETLTGGSTSGAGTGAAAAIVQNATTAPAAIHALGGVGKTRAAIEYAWAYQHDYRALLFVTAASGDLLHEGMAGLTSSLILDLDEKTATRQQQRYDAALRWLQHHSNWYLILDNVDTQPAVKAVTALLPKLANGHVVITSRLANWAASIAELDLNVLSPEAGVAFLMDRTGGRRKRCEDDPAQALELAGRLDGLALALEQAGSYISKLHIGFQQYLQRLDASAAKLLQWHDASLMEYPRSVSETWLTTFEKLNDAEQRLLHVLAWYDGEPIPVWLLDCWPDGSLGDVPETLAGLADWHLVKFSSDAATFHLHRLVQEVTRLRLPVGTAGVPSLTLALEWLQLADLDRPEDAHSWPRWEPLQPHALRLAGHATREQLWGPAVHWRTLTAELLYYKGLYGEAEPLFRDALALAEECLPPDDADLARCLGSLGYLLHSTNRLAEAELLYQRAIVIDEKNSGADGNDLGRDLNYMALLLQATQRQEEAEPMFLRAMDIYEKIYGSEHSEVAAVLNNLALLMRETNRLAEAEALLLRALAIDEKNYGPHHLQVATELFNLAELWHASHRLKDAEQLYRRALSIMEAVYGPEHIELTACLHNLSEILIESQRAAEAEPLLRRSLAITEKSYADNHPEIGNALFKLAELLEATDRPKKSEPLYRRALKVTEAALGTDHPEVATSLLVLGALLQATNQSKKAEPLFRRALAINEKALGPDHLEVATALHNLADLLHTTGRSAEAEPLYRRSLAITEKNHGLNHLEVVTPLVNLGELLHTTGRSEEAEPLFRRALAVCDHHHAPDHFEVATPLHFLAELLHATDRSLEAEPLFRRSLAITEKHCPPGDSELATALHSLAELLHVTHQLEEAEPLYRRALAVSEQHFGPDHPEVGNSLHHLAELLHDTGQLAEAELLFRRSLSITENSQGSDDAEVVLVLDALARLLMDRGQLEEAERLYRRSLAADQHNLSSDHPDVARDFFSLARVLHARRRLAKAERTVLQALAIDEKKLGPEHPEVAADLYLLAVILQARGRESEAGLACLRAAAILRESETALLSDMAHKWMPLAFDLHRGGRPGDALPVIECALRIYQHLSEKLGRPVAGLSKALGMREDIRASLPPQAGT